MTKRTSGKTACSICGGEFCQSSQQISRLPTYATIARHHKGSKVQPFLPAFISSVLASSDDVFLQLGGGTKNLLEVLLAVGLGIKVDDLDIHHTGCALREEVPASDITTFLVLRPFIIMSSIRPPAFLVFFQKINNEVGLLVARPPPSRHAASPAAFLRCKAESKKRRTRRRWCRQ